MPLKEDTIFFKFDGSFSQLLLRIHVVSWDGPVTQGVINWLCSSF